MQAFDDPNDRAPRRRKSPRERLIDATLTCVARDGLYVFNVAAAAKEAGVGRATVYRHFADRDELLRDAFIYVGEKLAHTAATRIADLATPAQMAVEGTLNALRLVASHPVIVPVWRVYPQDFGRKADLRNGTIGCQPLLDAMGWSGKEAEEAVCVIMRTITSLGTMPLSPNDDDNVRRYLRRRLLPALGIPED